MERKGGLGIGRALEGALERTMWWRLNHELGVVFGQGDFIHMKKGVIQAMVALGFLVFFLFTDSEER